MLPRCHIEMDFRTQRFNHIDHRTDWIPSQMFGGVVPDIDIIRPDPKDCLRPAQRLITRDSLLRNGKLKISRTDQKTTILRKDSTGNKFNPGVSEKARHKEVDRIIIDLQRRTDLLNPSVLHHYNLCPHGHRLDLIVSDIDDRRLKAVVKFRELGPHLDPEFRIQVGKGLIE